MAVFGDDQVGRVLGARYRLIAAVGAGASATVYVAEDVQLRRRVAVKLLHPSLADDPAFLKRFRAEAQAAAALSHPNIMAVYDWGEEGMTPYLITEFLGGGSLRAMLDRSRLLSPSQALLVGLETARGLDYAHRRGFVHRDIKPANLLFGEDSRLRIADFGLARAIAEAAWTEPAGVVLGTARYASPEQAKGQSVNGKTDVYSLALTLVESVTGHVPFAADTTVATLMNRLDKLMPVQAELGPLASVLERAGRPWPEERFDAAELGRALILAAERLPRPAPLPLVRTTAAGPADETTIAKPGEPATAAVTGAPPGRTAAPAVEGAAAGATGPAGPAGTAGGPAVPGAPDAPPAGAPGASTANPVAPGAGTAPASGAATGRAADAARSARLPGAAGGGVAAAARPAGAPPARPGAAAPAGQPAGAPPGPTASGATAVTERSRLRPDATAALPATPGGTGPGPGAPPIPAGGDRGDGQRSRRSLRWFLLVLILLVVAGVGAVGVVVYQRTRTPSYAVRDLHGLSLPQAQNVISEYGWDVQVQHERTDTQPYGNVFNQQPVTGKLKKGAVFTLWVSDGPVLHAVPELKGLTQDQATATLQGLSLKLNAAGQAFDENAAPGTVLDWTVDQQRVPAGSQLETGKTVDVVVSAGPEPRTIPQLAKIPYDQAVAALQQLRLQVNRADDQFNDSVPAGAVIASNPPAGAQVARDSIVTVVVSKGPDVVPVPDLKGMTIDQATAALQQAQLALGQTAGPGTGTVIAFNPPAGTPAKRGSTVNILLG